MSAIDAVKSILGAPPNWPQVRPSDECRENEHDGCDGVTWDFANDRYVSCICECHANTKGAAMRGTFDGGEWVPEQVQTAPPIPGADETEDTE